MYIFCCFTIFLICLSESIELYKTASPLSGKTANTPKTKAEPSKAKTSPGLYTTPGPMTSVSKKAKAPSKGKELPLSSITYHNIGFNFQTCGQYCKSVNKKCVDNDIQNLATPSGCYNAIVNLNLANQLLPGKSYSSTTCQKGIFMSFNGACLYNVYQQYCYAGLGKNCSASPIGSNDDGIVGNNDRFICSCRT